MLDDIILAGVIGLVLIILFTTVGVIWGMVSIRRAQIQSQEAIERTKVEGMSRITIRAIVDDYLEEKERNK